MNETGEWVLAFVLSVVLNLLTILAFVGWMEIERQSRRQAPPVPEPEVVALIQPEWIERVEEAAAPEKPVERPRGYARTSPDQEGAPPEQARYLGQRDTRAASELDPAPGTLDVPSQAGIDPRHEGEMETTESRYQDGTLEHDRIANPDAAANPTPPAPATEAASAEPPPAPPDDPAKPSPPLDPVPPSVAKAGDAPKTEEAKEPMPPDETPTAPEPAKLLEGPNPVERPPVPEEMSQQPKERPPARTEEGSTRQPAKDLTVRNPPARPQNDPKEPGFRGFQQKTRLKGSISRRGVAALDVADSALGRYYEIVSRAVEREWQRNCVRYRDHITPGWITVRFVITERGEVRSIGFVEAVEVGEIQKGFTLNAIRQAELPKMPDAVKRELDGEPLELIYNFYF